MPAQQETDVAEQFGGFHKASLAHQPGSHAAFAGSGEINAAFRQDADIILRGRMGVDAHIHGRGNQQRAAGRQRGDGEQVIGNAVGQFAERVGSAWGNHQQVGAVPETDVQNMCLPAPQVGIA